MRSIQDGKGPTEFQVEQVSDDMMKLCALIEEEPRTALEKTDMFDSVSSLLGATVFLVQFDEGVGCLHPRRQAQTT